MMLLYNNYWWSNQRSTISFFSFLFAQVLDILRSTELFAPHVAEVKGRNEDPVTTDLVGALLLVSISFSVLFPLPLLSGSCILCNALECKSCSTWNLRIVPYEPYSLELECVCSMCESVHGGSFKANLWSYSQHAAIIYDWSKRDRSSPAIFDGVPTRPPWNLLTANCTRDLCYRAWITSAFRSNWERCWKTILSGTLMSSVWRSSPASGEKIDAKHSYTHIIACYIGSASYVLLLQRSLSIHTSLSPCVLCTGRWCGSGWQSWLVSKCRGRSIATKLPCKTGWRWSRPITTRQIRTTIQRTQLTSSNRRPISYSATASRHFSILLI